MSTADSKLALVQMIVESEDKTFIAKMVEYARSLKKENTADWGDDLPDHVADQLLKSIEEADRGETIPHEIVMDRVKNRHARRNR